ncbi:hypothetical protein JX085_003514 [Vibrio cholerae]|uniref:hypothetical protein n=1 Tax=Vibrio cholerae TaxID=666 RepID=UPI001D93F442|nr:hypothetical protein [Vibrio vulnificus]EGR1265468.1 hypothetical protein [Vibrio cholerae]EHB5529339.1 hypothetical protein [Vibrio cholerae]EJL6503568.1 hypothetical protein [Vibrio cholerae]EMC3732765.1 hypothetical protein [Vibrio cholerae]
MERTSVLYLPANFNGESLIADVVGWCNHHIEVEFEYLNQKLRLSSNEAFVYRNRYKSDDKIQICIELLEECLDIDGFYEKTGYNRNIFVCGYKKTVTQKFFLSKNVRHEYYVTFQIPRFGDRVASMSEPIWESKHYAVGPSLMESMEDILRHVTDVLIMMCYK